MERRSKSTGAIVHPHFQAALTALQPIEPQKIIDAWGMSGATGTKMTQVEPYDPAQAGIEYICKQAADHDCDLRLRDIEFFSPSMPKPHMGARAARRWQHQLAQILSEDTQQFQSRVQIGEEDMKVRVQKAPPAEVGRIRSVHRDSSQIVNRDQIIKSAHFGLPKATVVVVPASTSR
jgi:hypothetical protein